MSKEFIKSLSPSECDVFANMIMRSLRGSWNSPGQRTELLISLTNHGELNSYDAESVRSTAETFLNRNPRDGRIFRHIYEDSDVSVADISEEKARQMASYMSYDLTWDNWMFEKTFGESNE